ncbi:MAG TPA: GAF domain-containing protein [Chloroflexi bacterium]|nr:GAF domain-containing protein [Chloroflexota bacterium]
MLFGRGLAGIWDELMEVAGSSRPYKEKLQAILEAVRRLTGTEACYLYFLDTTGRRFMLEHLVVTEVEEKRIARPEDVLGVPAGTEDVRSVLGAPPLSLVRSPADEEARPVTTETGAFYSVPLKQEGQLKGLIQMGPFLKGVPGGVRKRMAQIAHPLSLALLQVKREEELRERARAIEARTRIGRRMLGSTLELDRFVSLLLDLSLKATKTEAGFVAVADPQTRELTIRAAVNIPKEFLESVNLSPEDGLFEWPTEMGGAMFLRDLEFAQRMGVKSILAVPLMEDEEPLGVFALVNFGKSRPFTDYTVKLLSTFAEQIKLVVHNVRLFGLFTARYLDTVKALAKALDARHPSTVSHHERVAEVAVKIARRMGLSEEEVEAIRTAGLIHDVGMCGIVEEEGVRVDYEHPLIGASLIEMLPISPEVVQAVATHHEWFDGWGYPQGLKGEEISLGGRILALAEYFVEVTTPDEVRPALSTEKLIEEVKRRRGSQFDPQVVDAFLSEFANQE